jgi:WD40 repeat protein
MTIEPLSATSTSQFPETTQPPSRYWCFISYSRTDTKEAAQVQRFLENYRLPGRLGRSVTPPTGLKVRIRPVFRDLTDLSAAPHLSEGLRGALRASANLVVLCSPHAVASKWVNDEIEYFRSLGRDNAIFCVLLSGEPNSEDTLLECLPASVRELERGAQPVLADVRGGRAAFRQGCLRLVAGLHKISFDDLVRRHVRRQRRLAALSTAVVLVIVAVGTGLSAKVAYERVQLQQQKDKSIAEIAGQQQQRGDYGTALALALEALQRENLTMNGLPWWISIGNTIGNRLGFQVGPDADEEALKVAYQSFWNITELKVLVSENDIIRRALFTPDGKQFIVLSRKSEVEFRDTRTGEVTFLIPCLKCDISDSNFTSDGKFMVAELGIENAGTVELYDLQAKGKAIRSFLNDDQALVQTAELSPDGKRLLTVSLHDAWRVWDTTNGNLITKQTLPGLVTAHFFANGEFVATLNASYSSNDAPTHAWIRKWEVPDTDVKPVITHETKLPEQFPKSILVDRRVRGRRSFFVATLTDVIGVVTQVGGNLQWQDKFVTYSGNKDIHAATDDSIDKKHLESAGYDPNSPARIAVGYRDGTVRVFFADENAELRKERLAFTGRTYPDVSNLTFSPDGMQIAVSSDNKLKILSASSAEIIMEGIGHTGAIQSLSYSPDGRYLLSAAVDGTVRLWRAKPIIPPG